MSHIFDTLRRIEGERNGTDTRVQPDAVDLLGLAERKFPPSSETTFRPPTSEARRSPAVQEQRLRVVGSPLSVGGKKPASASVSAITAPAATVPVTAIEPEAPAAEIPSAVELTAQASEPQVVVVEEVATAVEVIAATPEPVVEVEESVPAVEVEAVAPQAVAPEVVESIEPKVSTVAAIEEPVVEAQQAVAAREAAPVQQEMIQSHPVEEPQVKLPASVMRVVSVIRTGLPFAKRLLPLLEGNVGAAISNLIGTEEVEKASVTPVAEIEIAPLQAGLAELKARQNELGEQVVEQGHSLQRIDDQLEMVRQSTDRNTLEQAELIEELKDVGKKVNTVVLIALVLLGITVVLNTVLYLHIAKVLR